VTAKRYLLDDEAAPLGLLEAADPPLVPPLLDAAPPLPPLDIAPLLVPPVAPDGVSVLELALELGLLGAVVVEEDEDEPPGTTTVSRFSVVEEDADPLGEPPGTTVVVSLRSHAENARALTRITTQLPSFMSTLLSSTFVAGCNTGLASTMPDRRQLTASSGLS
jgi:hypothetical protein